jgi:histidinol-phosphate aminotransferase
MPSYRDLVKASVLKQPIYEPGRPIELVAKEFGHEPKQILKLASNENPLGPSPMALDAASRVLPQMQFYPENSSFFLRKQLSRCLGIDVDQIIVGHGSNEIINLLGAAFVEPGVEVVMGEHAFIAYKLATLLYGGKVVEVPLVNFQHDLDAMTRAITARTRLVFLPCPNNPTGAGNTTEQIYAFVKRLPDHIILGFDAAYAEYMESPPDLRPFIAAGKKIICLQTFSKIYGLAGLRIGYGYANPELIALLNCVRPPFNVNSVAQAAALAALDDEDFIKKSRAINRAGLIQLEKGFAALGLKYIPSQGNFILICIGSKADLLFHYLQTQGIIVRPLKGYGLPEYLRVTVGTEEQNERLLKQVQLGLDSLNI